MNKEKLNYTNIIQWHNAGYKGKGVKIALQDLNSTKFNPNWFPTSKIIKSNISEYRTTESGISNNHLAYQIGSALLFAPDAEIHVVGGSPNQFLQYLIANDIDIYTHSVTSTWNNDFNNSQESQLLAMDNVLFTAAGNTDDGGFIQLGNKGTWISIGAAHLFNGVPCRDGYSCFDNHNLAVKAMFFTSYFLSPENNTGDGTSFASPSFAGTYAVWRGAFKQLYGRKPNRAETMSFIKNNCEAMNDEHKFSTGYGFFRMPNVNTEFSVIKHEPVAVDKEEILELWINSNQAIRNGEHVILDIPPALIKDHTMVGLRDLAELFGAKVIWKQSEQKITITYNKQTLVLLIDNYTAKKDGSNVKLDIAPTLLKDHTMIGLRDIATLFGFEVAWRQIEKKITITKKL